MEVLNVIMVCVVGLLACLIFMNRGKEGEGYEEQRPSSEARDLRISSISKAAEVGDAPEIERYLVEDPSLIGIKNAAGMTLLHLAVQGGSEEAANLLMIKGADKNSKNTTGATPLHLAAQVGDIVLVELLLGWGADRNVTDKDGCTPKDLAEQEGHAEVVELLQRTTPDESVDLMEDPEETPEDLIDAEDDTLDRE